MICAFTVILGFGFIKAYGVAAEHGVLGSTAKAKYANQSTGGFGAVFVDGRATFYIGLKAVADSPVIGHGSWARDTKYTIEGLADIRKAGYRVDPNLENELLHEDIIPSHSYVLGSWVDAGIVGGIFWLVILVLVGGVFMTYYRVGDPIAPLVAFLMMFLSWSILFSPYSGQQRVLASYAIIVMLYAWRLSRGAGERLDASTSEFVSRAIAAGQPSSIVRRERLRGRWFARSPWKGDAARIDDRPATPTSDEAAQL